MGIEKINGVFYAVLAVPADVRGILGRSKFRKTLETQDRTVAEERARGLVAGWKLQIKEARRTDPDAVKSFATGANQRLKDGEAGSLAVAIVSKANQIQAELGQDAFENFYDAVSERKTMIKPYIEPFLKVYKKRERVKDETVNLRRKDLETFCVSFQFIEDVNRKALGKWFQNQDKLSAKTVARILVPVRALFEYLYMQDVIEDEPVIKIDFGRGLEIETIRRSWGDDEIKTLFDGLGKKCRSHIRDNIVDACIISMFSGMRIEEVVNLSSADIVCENGVRAFWVRGTKTTASERKVPIHSALLDMPRLQKPREFFDIDVPGDRKSKNIVNTFSKRKTELGFSAELVIHGFRHGVATRLQNARVPESDVANILGHLHKSLTFRVYSDGLYLPQKQEAIEKLKYGVKVSEYWSK